MTEGFRTVVCDAPWTFSDRLPGNTRGALENYRCMTVDQIKGYWPTVPEVVADDALLFFWRVAAMQEEALEVVRAWGFVPKAEVVWVKTRKGGLSEGLAFGMGRYVRAAHEVCIIARRGRGAVRVKNVRSVFFAPRGRHSEKPPEFFDLVERLAEGPYLELFSRTERPGWTQLGLERGVLR